jgi:hypothetical protein
MADGKKFLGYKTDYISAEGRNFCPQEHQIAPVDYDGDKAGSWDECLWKPGNTPFTKTHYTEWTYRIDHNDEWDKPKRNNNPFYDYDDDEE